MRAFFSQSKCDLDFENWCMFMEVKILACLWKLKAITTNPTVCCTFACQLVIQCCQSQSQTSFISEFLQAELAKLSNLYRKRWSSVDVWGYNNVQWWHAASINSVWVVPFYIWVNLPILTLNVSITTPVARVYRTCKDKNWL